MNQEFISINKGQICETVQHMLIRLHAFTARLTIDYPNTSNDKALTI